MPMGYFRGSRAFLLFPAVGGGGAGQEYLLNCRQQGFRQSAEEAYLKPAAISLPPPEGGLSHMMRCGVSTSAGVSGEELVVGWVASPAEGSMQTTFRIRTAAASAAHVR